MKKRWIGLCTALILLAGVCVSRPLTSGAAPADPVDLDRTCSLKITPVLPPDSQDPVDYWEDMQNAKLVLDLYKIAGATKVPGYDTYTFDPAGEYTELNISDYSDLQAMSAADWEAKAQDAAKIALLDENSQKKTMEAVKDGVVLDGLDPGLYLVVPRGEDLTSPSDYVKMVGEMLSTGLGETEITHTEEKLVTIANTARYEYAFTPQLIALPTKPEDADGVLNTANPGAWAYNREIFLKWERNQRYGDLEIIKTLQNYEEVEGTIEPVTFVFHVTAVLDGGTVYDEVESLTFSGDAGTDRVTMTGIPATAQVTVREEYTGISYTQVVPANNGTASNTIVADSVVPVNFENIYNNNRTHGHGIKNRFVYNEAENEWEWHPDPEQTVREEGE